MHDFHCPRCRTRERPANAAAAERLKRSRRCQGCRALDTLQARPWLLPLFVGFWRNAGFPASDEWFRGLAAPADGAAGSKTAEGTATCAAPG